MYRIDTPTAAGALPAPQAAGAGGYFAFAPPGSGNAPTIVSSDWCNAIQEELMTPILYAGIAPDKANHGQLLAALLSIIGSSSVVGAGAIFGLTLANAAANPTTAITISAGLTRDSTNTAGITLAAPITKVLTAPWAAGDGNGGRDAGALANGQTWHVFAILDPDTNVVDALFSQSATAPTLPAGFTKFRRLGAVVLDAAATTIRRFRQSGDWFEYVTRSADYAAQSNGGAPFYRAVAVPAGIKVEVEFYFQSVGATGDSNIYLSGLYDPDLGVPAAFGAPTQWAQIRRANFYSQTSSGNIFASYQTVIARQFTDAAAHVYTFSSDANDVIALGVIRWRDERGKFF